MTEKAPLACFACVCLCVCVSVCALCKWFYRTRGKINQDFHEWNLSFVRSQEEWHLRGPVSPRSLLISSRKLGVRSVGIHFWSKDRGREKTPEKKKMMWRVGREWVGVSSFQTQPWKEARLSPRRVSEKWQKRGVKGKYRWWISCVSKKLLPDCGAGRRQLATLA